MEEAKNIDREKAKIEEYFRGYEQGIEDATRIFYCKNYEKEDKS